VEILGLQEEDLKAIGILDELFHVSFENGGLVQVEKDELVRAAGII